MKRYLYITLLCTIGLLQGCKKDDIALFSGKNELFFEKFFENERFPGKKTADSTEVSFFLYPDGTQDITASLVIHLSGKLLDSPLPFQLRVVEDLTTAHADEYTIDPEYIFDPKTHPDSLSVKDTIQIKLHRSSRLEQLPAGARLVVELVPNERFNGGQLERRRAAIIVSTLAQKPNWWTEEVTENLLGTYSDKKFKLFLTEVDVKGEMSEELIKERPDIATKLTLQFKEWLNQQTPPVLEENGEVMRVAL